MHTQANVDENLPEEVVREEFPFLLFDSSAKVTMLAVLHYYANSLLSYKTVIISDYKMTVNFHHYLDLLHCFQSGAFRKNAHIDFFDDVVLISV